MPDSNMIDSNMPDCKNNEITHSYKGSDPIDLTYDCEKQSFSITLFGKNRLGSQMIARIGKYTAIPEKVSFISGIDEFGLCRQWIIEYVSSANSKRTMTAKICLHDGFIVFESTNHYLIEGKDTKHPFGYPYIGFPSFEGDQWENDLSVLTFKRQAPFNYPEQWHGQITGSLREGRNMPLMATNNSFETIVISPLSHLLHGVVSIRHRPPSVSCGLPRATKIVPEGTVSQTILVYGLGVNRTIEHWGQLLSYKYHTKPIAMDADRLLTHISYWTNAGSAYWYNTVHGSNYESTLTNLKKHHDSIGLHFGSYQLDSWWYKRENEGYTGGIIEWEPRSKALKVNYNTILPRHRTPKSLSIFSEDRLSLIQNLIKTPIGCHFKQLSNESVYVKNNPDAFFHGEYAVPKEEYAFQLFKKIFDHPKWKLSFIVHDWLQWMNDRHDAFLDLETARGYFLGLDKALCDLPANENNCGHITLQLCMTQPHMTLNAVTMKSVTSIRSTSDSNSFFVEGPLRWWWHLYSSRFIEALGKYAFFDTRRSDKIRWLFQSGQFKLEMIWLCLSCGPIGLGDRLGREKMKLLLPVIHADGRIIKPDTPAKLLDRCYLLLPRNSKCREGVTVFSGNSVVFIFSIFEKIEYRILYLLSMNMNPIGKSVNISFNLVEAGAQRDCIYAIYNPQTKNMTVVASSTSINKQLKKRKHTYIIAARVIDGVAFLGDVSKHVSASQSLITEIKCDESTWIINGKYSKNETSYWVFYCEHQVTEAYLNGKLIHIKQADSTVFLKSLGENTLEQYILVLCFKKG